MANTMTLYCPIAVSSADISTDYWTTDLDACSYGSGTQTAYFDAVYGSITNIGTEVFSESTLTDSTFIREAYYKTGSSWIYIDSSGIVSDSGSC